jgi:hypothetical protein
MQSQGHTVLPGTRSLERAAGGALVRRVPALEEEVPVCCLSQSLIEHVTFQLMIAAQLHGAVARLKAPLTVNPG